VEISDIAESVILELYNLPASEEDDVTKSVTKIITEGLEQMQAVQLPPVPAHVQGEFDENGRFEIGHLFIALEWRCDARYKLDGTEDKDSGCQESLESLGVEDKGIWFCSPKWVVENGSPGCDCGCNMFLFKSHISENAVDG